MAIRVTRELRSWIVKYPGQISLQVQGAADQEAAAAALRSALAEIRTLGSTRFSEGGDPLTPNYIGGTAEVPTGPFITLIDAPMVPLDEVARIPEIVSRHLIEAGIDDAVLAVPAHEGALDDLNTVARAMVLRLYLPVQNDWLYRSERSREWPKRWREQAAAWVTAGVKEDDIVHTRVSGVQFPVLGSDVRPLLERYKSGGNYLLVSGALDGHLRAIHTTEGMALAAGGPATTDDEMLAIAGDLIDVARGLADELGYSFVTLEPSFRYFGFMRPVYDWAISGQGDPPEIAEPLWDEFVLDAFPWQLLGPGHLARLGDPFSGGRRIAAGRVELPLGELADWLPGNSAIQELREQGRQLLAPCLLKQGEGSPIHRARWEAAQRRPRDKSEERGRDQAGQ